MKEIWIPLAFACVAMGCQQEAVHDVALADQGALCIRGEAEPAIWSEHQRIDAGERVVVTVELDRCLSSSCDVDRVASCVVERQGKTLRVHSYLGYATLDDAACSRDCGRLVAKCQSEPLGTGVYEVALGDQRRALAVPSSSDGPCL